MKLNNCEIDLTSGAVMAIVNVTPDSFYAASRTAEREAVARRIREAVDEGATLLDIGGYSSRPGADEVAPEEEWRRVALGMEVARSIAPQVAVSIDTFRSEIVRRTVDRFGEVVVNDISAGELDAAMVPTVAALGLPYIAMHMRGTPQTMQARSDYHRPIAEEVADFFRAKCAQLAAAGIRSEQIVLDPGFGFAKSTEQNYELLAGLDAICAMGYPVLAGVSRKSMIYKTLDTTPAESLAGTVALGWECLSRGARILRVHDVREAVDTVRIFNKYQTCKRKL